MSIFRQIPPTAGYPLYARDFLRIAQPGNLADDFKQFLGAPYARVTCSGTAAFYVILETIKQRTGKRGVVIPAFTCPLVGLAIARAGFNNVVCDVQPSRLDYDMVQLETVCANNPDIAAIVVTHLGGMPAELAAIQVIAAKHNIILIEDCAQGLGTEYDGRKIGTFGEFAFFSFARGKGMTLYEGGVLVSNRAENSAVLEENYARLVPKDWWMEITTFLGLLGYGVMYRPTLFWFIFDLTYHFWNWRGDNIRAAAEYNHIDFPVYRMSRLRQKLGHAFFHRVPAQLVRQRESAERYFAALKGDFTMIKSLSNTLPSYPYVTLLFPSREKRDAMLERIRARGLGAFIIYIRALADYDYMRPHIPAGVWPNAKHIADCTMTLTTNLYLDENDRAEILRLLENA